MSIVKYDESTALSADSHTNTESTGPMIAAAAMEEEVSLQVADYYFVDSGALFDQHYFMIQVTIEHFKYMVDRTYVDFVRLDQSLRKKFPETKICPLPLDSKKEIAKLILKDSPQHTAASKGVDGSSPLNSSRTSFLYSRESMQRSTSVMSHGTSPLRIHSTFAIPASHTEVISAKGKLLEAYLRELLTKHEVVSSDELLRFLDEELRRVDAFELEESLSVHDLLLLSTTPIRCIVTKSEEHGFHVPPGHMVVWRFETRHFDIGFCVEMDGDAKVPYTRCSSHKAPVCGALEATDKSSVCLLKWDNSYAKFRSKTLSWAARVVSAEEFHLAKTQALECQREKKRFEQQRFALQRCAIQQAARISGGVLVLDSSIEPVYAKEESAHIRELEEEVMRLQREIGSSAAGLRRVKEERDQALLRADAAERSRDAVSASWQYSSSQLQDCKRSLQESYQGIEELNADLDQKEALIEERQQDLETLKQELVQMSSIMDTVEHTCLQEVAKHEADRSKLQRRLQERRQDWAIMKSSGSTAAAADNNNNINNINNNNNNMNMNNNNKTAAARMVEKLLADLDKCALQLDLKNEVLKGLAEYVATPTPP